LLLCVAITYAQNWTIVDNDYATIAMSCSFQTPTNGWIGGARGDLQALVLHTNNAGVNLTNANMTDFKDALFMAISMSSSTTGVTGGLGFFGLPCGAITTNGKDWQRLHRDQENLFCAFQSACAVPGGKSFVLTGSWVDVTDLKGNGIKITTDSGKNWHQRNWNMGTPARYGSFINDNVGWVSGGIWPETDSSERQIGKFPYAISQYLVHYGNKIEIRNQKQFAVNTTGYQAVIAKTTDGGKTWTAQLNLTGTGVYFNEISFVDSNNGWAVCEGIDNTTGANTAYVYGTKNGGTTWTKQLTFPLGSLLTVNFITSSYGWIAGMNLAHDEGTAFFTTNGGSTWTQSNQLKNFYFSQVSTVSSTSAFASGLTKLGLSSLARFG